MAVTKSFEVEELQQNVKILTEMLSEANAKSLEASDGFSSRASNSRRASSATKELNNSTASAMEVVKLTKLNSKLEKQVKQNSKAMIALELKLSDVESNFNVRYSIKFVVFHSNMYNDHHLQFEFI